MVSLQVAIDTRYIYIYIYNSKEIMTRLLKHILKNGIFL